MSFSRDQLRAIAHAEGPALVLAGPGSGKTTVITHRILRLIFEHGISPSHILVITFTKAAASEMEARFERLLQSEKQGADLTESVTFGTFHSVFFNILKLNYHLSAKNIVTESEKLLIIRELIGQEQLDLEEDNEFFGQVLSEISYLKGEGKNPDAFSSKLLEQDSFVRVYKGYQDRLRARRMIDFDDMMSMCYALLRKKPEERRVWQEKYRYILVDEFQDINRMQYEVVKMLAAPRRNLFIVGDDDQSIYGFRGAKPEIMLGFPRDFAGTKRILLGNNYRSRGEIVDYAGNVIENNRKRFQKQITAMRGKGGQVFRHDGEDTAAETALVLEQIEKELSAGYEPDAIAVLYRTGAQAQPLAEALCRRQLPFVMKERLHNPYEHFVAKDLIAYIRLSLGIGTRGDFLRVMNRPLRYISRALASGETVNIGALLRAYENKPELRRRVEVLLADLNTVRRLPTAAALIYIRKKIGYEGWLEDYALQNHVEMQAFHGIMEELESSALACPDKRKWLAWTQGYGQMLLAKKNRAEEHGVRLMTYHASKGLEFQSVHMVGCVEGLTPYRKAEGADALEEERRAFYVACTRAKERLHIYVTKTRYHKACKPSRFVPEGEKTHGKGKFWKRITGRGADDRHADT